MAKPSKRMIKAEDVYNIIVLESPRWNPAGDEAIYVQLKPDRAKNGYQRTLWRWREGWEAPRQFTNGGSMDFNPQYSPDGERVAFVSSRGGKPQVYLIRTDGGEAKQLTNMPNGVNGFSWSPDGKSLALVSSRLGSPQIFIVDLASGASRRPKSAASPSMQRRCRQSISDAAASC